MSYWLYAAGVRGFADWDERGDIYCPRWVDSFRNRGAWKDSNPQPGDVVFYAWSPGSGVADHVGIVEAVNDDGTIVTIEGNTDDPSLPAYQCGNACRRKRRTTFYVLGYGMPAYDAARKPNRNPKPQGSAIPVFTLPPGHYYGDIKGPTESHGGGRRCRAGGRVVDSATPAGTGICAVRR